MYDFLKIGLPKENSGVKKRFGKHGEGICPGLWVFYTQ